MGEFKLVVRRGVFTYSFKASSVSEAFGILEDIGGGFFQLVDSGGRVRSVGHVFFYKPSWSSCSAECLTVVMDQMFKGLGGLLVERLTCIKARVYEVNEDAWGRLEGGEVSAVRASSDEDIIRLLEKIAGEGRIVVLFTGDKKLATAVKEKGSLVEAHYIPPGKHEDGKDIVEEMAMRIMARAGVYCGESQNK